LLIFDLLSARLYGLKVHRDEEINNDAVNLSLTPRELAALTLAIICIPAELSSTKAIGIREVISLAGVGVSDRVFVPFPS
jgi:hypothetical protein